MPDTPPVAPPSSNGSQEPEIHVIPERYYGAALKAKVVEQAPKPEAGAIAPPPKGKTGLIVGIVLLLLLVSAGAFAYFNQALLFPKPAPTPVAQTPKPPPPPTPPSAPTDTQATSTSPQSVALSWTDTSNNETGFRVERAGTDGSFTSVTNLPSGSTSFLDTSVQASTTYSYRVIAINDGGESGPSPVATVMVQPPPPPPPVGPKLPPAGLDSDSDGLTDLEETTIYHTDPHNPDTAGNSFPDGTQVQNLYNPRSVSPRMLVDSGLVKVVQAPIGWSLFVPAPWTVDMLGDGATTTITTGHGETFTVSIGQNPNHKPLIDWYVSQHPEVQRSQVLQYLSKKGYPGIIIAPDQLETYVAWNDRVFIFTYGIDGQAFINYRTTYYMMLNSLVLKGMPTVPTIAIIGEPFPPEVGVTTSSAPIQPQPQNVFPSPGASTSTPSSSPSGTGGTEAPPPVVSSSTAPTSTPPQPTPGP